MTLTLDDLMVDDNIDVPDVSLLTTRDLKGTGVFDVLMDTVRMHLQAEWDAGRITGEQYSQVYVSALSAVLQQSTTYILNHKTAKKIDADIGLTRQKIVTELTNTDNDIPAGLGYNGTTAVEGMVASQLTLTAKQEDLVDEQILSATAEKDLVGQRIISELGNTDTNITTARAEGYGFNATNTIDGAMIGAKTKSEQEALFATYKANTEQANTVDTTTGLVGTTKALQESQKDKADQEIILLAQKAITELSQTADILPTDTNALTTVSTVTGSVKEQKDLMEAQNKGYSRDAEQKLLRIMTDGFIVEASGDAGRSSSDEAGDNLLGNASYGQVMTVARTGIGL